MRVWVLGSGSGGNAVLIETESSRILVDAGFAPRTLRQRLAVTGVAPESIEAVIVTHEHADHARGVSAAAKKWGWKVVSTSGTRMMCPDWAGLDLVAGAPSAVIAIGEFQIEMVAVSHDASEPVAVVVTSAASGARAGIVYDLGHVSEALSHAMKGLDVLVLEANHDEGMLRAGPYPPSVRMRIAGRLGHLSNSAAGRAAADSTHSGLGNIVLAHLSESCNDARTALKTVGGQLRRTTFRGRVTAAAQGSVTGPFAAGSRGAGPGAAMPLQLALGI